MLSGKRLLIDRVTGDKGRATIKEMIEKSLIKYTCMNDVKKLSALLTDKSVNPAFNSKFYYLLTTMKDVLS